jgi:type I restriction enzyme, S subunit
VKRNMPTSNNRKTRPFIGTWPVVKLGDVIIKSDDWIELDPVATYKELSVRLWGRGVVPRGEVLGSEVGNSRRIRVRAGQFILSRIDARNGAIGLVPEDLDGAVVSNDFPVFDTNPKLLLTEFLGWVSRTKAFVESCRAASEGTTNRVRIKEERFYGIEIRLPPLPEQRRIVEKIERLAGKIADAYGLRNQSVNETEVLSRNVSRQVFHDIRSCDRANLEEVCEEIIDCLHSNPVYCEDGIPTVRSPDVGWGKLFLETAKRTAYEEYVRRTRRGEPKAGDIILVREGGGTGKAGIVEDGQQLSLGQRVMQLRPNQKKVLPRYLLHQWLSPLIQEDQIAEMMKGSASPHLNIGSLKKFQVVIPPLKEQRRIADYLDGFQSKLERLKRLQTQTASELDALLPSILDKAFQEEL